MSKGGGGSYFLSSHCRGQNEGNGGCKDTSSFHSKMQNQTVGRAGKGPATRGQLLGPGLWAEGWQRFPCSQWAGSQPGQGWHMTDRLTQPQEGQGCSSLAFHQCSHSGHSPNTAQWIQSLADSILHSTSNKIQTLHQDLQGPFFFFFWLCWVFIAVLKLLLLQSTGSRVHRLSNCSPWLSYSVACGIIVPQSGIKPTSLALEGRFLTTGPAGESQDLSGPFWSGPFLAFWPQSNLLPRHSH